MKFLCTKVRRFWLTSPQNIERVKMAGLCVQDPYIGIEINKNEPTEEEYNIMNSAIDKLFGESKKAFPVKLINL